MWLDVTDEETLRHLDRYIEVLALPRDLMRITTQRATFARWIGRTVPSSYGGAYVYLSLVAEHAILINLERINRALPRSLEVVVAEELVHMRDRLDGDLRGHAKHGHDRIAHRVAELTGASLEEIRAALIPVKRRPPRYLYRCPGCGSLVARRTKGTWSCSRCSPRFDRRFVLELIGERETPT